MWRWLEDLLIKQSILRKGYGHAWVKRISWTGYSVAKDQAERVLRLEQLCLEATSNKDWVAHDITGDGKAETFCNRALRYISQGMGCYAFGQTDSANVILRKLAEHPQFKEVPLVLASHKAQEGKLVICGAPDLPHGHVTAVAPRAAEMSGSWGGLVPLVAQVGSLEVGIGVKKLSEAYGVRYKGTLKVYCWEDPDA